MPKIIGIGGCSRSGKSSLARKIKEQLSSKKVLLLDMDDYVLPESQIPKISDRTDWERPESVNYQKLIEIINEQKSNYDLIVVEGIQVFNNSALNKLFDKTIWLQISKQTFLERRRKETRWGDEPDWFLEHVWRSYIQYGQYPDADFTLSGEVGISNQTTEMIVSDIL